VNALAILAAAVLAAAPAGPHAWSIEMLDGSPAATSSLFQGIVIAPGNSFSSGFLIPHTADINGALDVRALPLSTPDALEDAISMTVGVNGVAGQTGDLDQMLRDGHAIRATDALPPGVATLDITLTMDPTLTTEAMRQQVRFVFSITVADRTIVVPVTPPSALASTGVDPPIGWLLAAAAAVIGAGIAAVSSRRRERPPRARPASQAAAILARWSPPSIADTGRRRSPN
jgi:hypothetical protein